MTVPIFREDQESWEREDGITVISRKVFCRDYFDYNPGEHVVFGGPSTRGKTSLAFDLLEYTASASLPAYVAVSKPQDPVTANRGTELGYRRVSEWPPPRKLSEIVKGEKPSGYLVWSNFGNLETDMQRCAELTHKLLEDRYSSGASKKNTGGILVMDDTMVKAKFMGLDAEMVKILAMAGAMKYGLWVFIQKPTDSGRTTLWSYEMATHIFFTGSRDDRMVKRYAEILGDNAKLAQRILPTLGPYEFLYCQRNDGYVCIVEAAPEK